MVKTMMSRRLRPWVDSRQSPWLGSATKTLRASIAYRPDGNVSGLRRKNVVGQGTYEGLQDYV